MKLQLLQELWPFFLAFVFLSVILVTTQRQYIYHPRSYSPAEYEQSKFTNIIKYTMGNHQQQAFFYSPLPSPKNILIICGGNASLALDWLYFVKHLPEKHLGVLLIDYPGYGNNKGYPSQKHNKDSVIHAYNALKSQLGYAPNLHLLGHSLGSAVATDAATSLVPKSLILLSPFTSIYAMAKRVISPPWAWLLQSFLWDRYNTEQTLDELASTMPSLDVYILHGDKDSVVPVSMGRALYNKHKDWIKYTEIADVDHQLPYESSKEVYNIIHQAIS